MSTTTENKCLRCRTDCIALANISSDSANKSFICVGYNKPEDRAIKNDRFTLCWKNAAVDERGFWDRRDLLDTQSVIAQALSIDENIKVSDELSDNDMNEVNFIDY